MTAFKMRRKGIDLRTLANITEEDENVLWELRNADVESTDNVWCSTADSLVDRGLVNEKDGLYSITEEGRMALRMAATAR